MKYFNQVTNEGRTEVRAIGTALFAGFLTLAFVVVGIDYWSLSTMEKVHAQMQSIADRQWIDVQLANEALDYSNINNRVFIQLMLTSDRAEVTSLLGDRAKNSARISTLEEQLQSRVASEKEQALLNAVNGTRRPYLESCNRAISILLNGKNPELARQALIRVTFPGLLQYHRAWGDYVHLRTDEMNQQLAAASAKYVAARKRTTYLMTLSVLLVLGIALVVLRRIMAEIRRRGAAEREIRQLNEGLELTVRQRTAALERANEYLTAEITERKQVEEKLRLKTAFLEAQTNSTLDGILVVDDNNRIILHNGRYAAMFRVPLHICEEGDDSPLLEHVLSLVRDPERFLGRVNYLYNHRQEISRDEIEFNDGRVVDRYSSPVIGREGKYYGRIWSFRDITERKRSDEVVRRLSLAVEQSPVSVVITELNGQIIYVNRKFVECTGYRLDEVIGKNPNILKSGHTKSEEYKKLWAAITAGKEWRGELQNRKKNGELYWEYAVIRPIADENGRATHFLALKEDITERRNMEVQLQHAQKLEAIGQLASGIAHEINTPTQYIGDNVSFLSEAFEDLRKLVADYERLMAAAKDNVISSEIVEEIRSAVERVDCGYLLEEIPKALAQTKEGINRVSKLVSAMKEFSHPGTKEKTPLDINRALESTITVSRNEWKYVSDLETDFDCSLPLVSCLPSELNQVILNLIVNAAHAIADVVPHGAAAKGKIHVRTLNCQDWVEIRVQDTGAGIPKEVQARIFEPFFTTKQVGKGTGQGLAIARSLVVDKHQGSIRFETVEGKGSTFIIRLPKDGKCVPSLAQRATV
ncbi:MAG: PAS domain S-box protein [Terriglobales bacterium]